MREVPVLVPIPRSGYWQLIDDVHITVDLAGRKISYFVPRGFVLRASLLHDYLYRTGHRIDRKYADWLFYKKLIEDKTPKWKAKLMYWAVRLFAKKVWEGYRKEDEE